VEHNFHGTDDQLELYALDRLADAELPQLESHLMICEVCREKLDEIGDFALAMREAAPARPEPAPKAVAADWLRWLRRPTFSIGPAFAVLAVATGIAVMRILSNGPTTFAPSASLQLTASRGEMPFTGPARQLVLTLVDGSREGGPFRVEVVNVTGAPAWSGMAERVPAGAEVRVTRRLTPGVYFLRLYSPAGDMLREYGFRIGR
jgi:hypothetical protein